MMNAIYPKTSVPKKMVACGMVNHAKKKEVKMMNAKTLQRNRNVSKHQVAGACLHFCFFVMFSHSSSSLPSSSHDSPFHMQPSFWAHSSSGRSHSSSPPSS